MKARPILFSGPMIGALLCVAALAMAGCASNDPMAQVAHKEMARCIQICGSARADARVTMHPPLTKYCQRVRSYVQRTGRLVDYANDPNCAPVE